MIILEEGSKDMLPWVQVEITTGRWPFEYWFEVSYWDESGFTDQDGKHHGCWVHDWERDGGGFGLWRILRKADIVMNQTWFDLLEEKNEK